MIRSLYSGVSGLQAHGMAIDVVADNIANVNTPGFKAARAQFQSLMAQTLRGAGSPITAGLQPVPDRPRRHHRHRRAPDDPGSRRPPDVLLT